MSLQLVNKQTVNTRLPELSQHERYGPYFIYPGFRRALDFGGGRRFELLIAAFRDPRVTPESYRGMLNGIVLIWHGTQHEVIVLEGHRRADRVHLDAPTEGQVFEFLRLSHISWEELVQFCRSTPATRPRWRQEDSWIGLTEREPGIGTGSTVDPETHAVGVEGRSAHLDPPGLPECDT